MPGYERLVSQVLNRAASSSSATFFKRALTTSATQYMAGKSVVIPLNKMSTVDELKKDKLYQLVFAKKAGLPVPDPFMPIRHSAIGFEIKDTNRYVVLGRQSPWDLSNWFTHGITFHTQMANEKDFLHPSFSFKAFLTDAYFTKEEIDHFIKSADELINQPQLCNMVSSNCYSASTTIMGLAIEALLRRPTINSKEISGLLTVLEEHALKDHFSIGVLNNSVVVNTLTRAILAVKKYADELANPAEIDKKLQSQANQLLKQLNYEEEVDQDNFAGCQL